MIGDHDPYIRSESSLGLGQGLRVVLNATRRGRIVLAEVYDSQVIDSKATLALCCKQGFNSAPTQDLHG